MATKKKQRKETSRYYQKSLQSSFFGWTIGVNNFYNGLGKGVATRRFIAQRPATEGAALTTMSDSFSTARAIWPSLECMCSGIYMYNHHQNSFRFASQSLAPTAQQIALDCHINYKLQVGVAS